MLSISYLFLPTAWRCRPAYLAGLCAFVILFACTAKEKSDDDDDSSGLGTGQGQTGEGVKVVAIGAGEAFTIESQGVSVSGQQGVIDFSGAISLEPVRDVFAAEEAAGVTILGVPVRFQTDPEGDDDGVLNGAYEISFQIIREGISAVDIAMLLIENPGSADENRVFIPNSALDITDHGDGVFTVKYWCSSPDVAFVAILSAGGVTPPPGFETPSPVAVLSGQPIGTARSLLLDVDVTGENGVVAYRYKVGANAAVACNQESGYCVERNIQQSIADDVSSVADGSIELCVIGRDTTGIWQAYASATSAVWTKDTTGPGSAGPLDATAGIAQVDLSWSTVGGAAGYLVLQQPDTAVSYTPQGGRVYADGEGLGAGLEVVYVGTGSSHNEVSLVNGTTYHYAVFAYDMLYNFSAGAADSARPMEAEGWSAAIQATGAPSARANHTAVWTGDRMVIWGGTNAMGSAYKTGGGRYDPVDNDWEATSTGTEPEGRQYHTAVWTGDVMVVWGGFGSGGKLKNGGRYDPDGDTWADTNTADAPAARYQHSAVWTGSEMIVWGGEDGTTALDTGSRYDPVADTWTPMSSTNAPSARMNHVAAWTGTHMIVWGGSDQTSSSFDNEGGIYNPALNTWTLTTTTNGTPPSARQLYSPHSRGLWTGQYFLAWGGYRSGSPQDTGGCYDPVGDTWLAINTATDPGARSEHTNIWTGSVMITWGGMNGTALNTGGKYNPVGDSWTAMSVAPVQRRRHSAVWTGSQMIIWGGVDNTGNEQGSGHKYSPGP